MAKPDSLGGPADPSRLLPWWTRPSALNLLFVLPVLLAVFWAGDTDFIASESRSPNYLSASYLALCVGLVLVSAVGAWLGEHVDQRDLLQSPVQHLVRAALGVGIVVLATYLFWYRSMLGNPAELIAILTGGLKKPEREDIGTLTGITSLVNLGPLYFSLAGYLLLVRKSRDRALIALTVVLLLFTLFRAYIWSERLAVVEAIVPLALALLSSSAGKSRQGGRRLLLVLGPYAALPVVFLFFAMAEYFRSWPYYEDRMAFWDFAVGRFVSYYYTSINNGAGMLATVSDWPTASFEFMLNWLHAFPLGIGEGFSALVGRSEFSAVNVIFLQRYGDPEFNSPSSFASIVSDVGVAGAIVYFFAATFCAGILYARYTRGDLLAVMLYPSVLVAMFESFRYCYWGTSRAFVWFLGTVTVLGVLWVCGAIGAATAARNGPRQPVA